MSENYRNVQIEIMGEKYKFKVNEPEEVINCILKEIKIEVEKLSKELTKDDPNYVLLLLLLNEKLKNIKMKEDVSDILQKIQTIVNSSSEKKESERMAYWE